MGNRIGQYELRGELGRGAMAIVWRAWDSSIGREVAIKEPLLPPGLVGAPRAEFILRFIREAQMAGRLNHPGIVTIYAADEFEGRPAIVMELVDGGTLADLLDNGPLPLDLAVPVLDQLLEAVAYAHSCGVVHRDLKPENIFVGRDGRVKLADFGIARLGGSTTLTQAGTVMGTPGYMAPEQVRGEEVDSRADLFALGAIAYEMLAGRNPFGVTEDAPPTTIMYRVVHEDPPPVTSMRADVPPFLAAIVAKALAKSRSERYQSAEEMRADLRSQTVPIVAGLPGRARRSGVVLAVVAAMLIVAGYLVFRPTGPIVQPATLGASQTTEGANATAAPPGAAAAARSYRLAMLRGTDLWVSRDDGREAHKLNTKGAAELSSFGTEGALNGLVWDASKKRFAFVALAEGCGTVWTCSVDGTARKTREDWAPKNVAMDIAPRPGGGFAALMYDGQVVALDPDKGPGAKLFKLGEETHPSSPPAHALAWSPDGSTFAYLNGSDHGVLFLGNADGTAMQQSPDSEFDECTALAWKPDSSKLAVGTTQGIDIYSRDGVKIRSRLYKTGGAGEVTGVAWSPDGSRIAFSLDQAMWVMKADGSDVKEIGEGKRPVWLDSSELGGE